MQLRVARFSSRLSQRRERSLRASCSARAAPRAPPRVRVAFQLPYRARFGQQLTLVGSGVLGEWDLRRAVPMTWSAGNIWKADLETNLSPGDTLQYKYVVCNADGDVAAWKPGENIVLRVPREVEGSGQAELQILDTWDGAIHEVAVETEPEVVARESYQGNEMQTTSVENFMMSALKSSYEDLEIKLDAAQTSLEAATDPAAMEMVLADRELAIAANRASALSKVVEAAQQAAELKDQKEGP